MEWLPDRQTVLSELWKSGANLQIIYKPPKEMRKKIAFRAIYLIWRKHVQVEFFIRFLNHHLSLNFIWNELGDSLRASLAKNENEL